MFFGQLPSTVVIPIPKKQATLNKGASECLSCGYSESSCHFTQRSKGCCRFHSTHKVGSWTSLTLNPSNALSTMLKTGGYGGLLTAVARWHVRNSRRRHDQASELCANPFALRVAQCLAAVVHRGWFGTTVRHLHTHRALAALQLVHRHTPSSCRPPPLRPPFTATTSRLVSLRRPYAPGCGRSSLKWGVSCWSGPRLIVADWAAR